MMHVIMMAVAVIFVLVEGMFQMTKTNYCARDLYFTDYHGWICTVRKRFSKMHTVQVIPVRMRFFHNLLKCITLMIIV